MKMFKSFTYQILVNLIFITPLINCYEVPYIDDKSFDWKITEHQYGMVFYSTMYCQKSRRVLPEYDKAAKVLMDNSPKAGLFVADCNAESEEICKGLHDHMYPLIKVYKEGNFLHNYDGKLTWYDIVKHMKGLLKPIYQKVKEKEELQKILDTEKYPVAVGYFSENSNLKFSFEAVAQELYLRFLIFINAAYDLIPNNSMAANELITLYRPKYLENKFEEAFVNYCGEADPEELRKFIIDNMHGLAGVRNLYNYDDFVLPYIVVYLNLDYELNIQSTQYWRNRVLVVAKEFKNDVKFAVSSISEMDEELRLVGIDCDTIDTPIALAVNRNYGKYLLHEKVFTAEILRKFTKDFLESKLKRAIKSQPVPKEQEEIVKVAVAINFDNLVTRNQKDTMVMFYASWCSYSQALLPFYERLAIDMEEEDVAFVKMDAEANEIPEMFEIQGYPTIYWIPKERHADPIRYIGKRTIGELTKFIAAHSNKELEGWDRLGEVKAKVEL